MKSGLGYGTTFTTARLITSCMTHGKMRTYKRGQPVCGHCAQMSGTNKMPLTKLDVTNFQKHKRLVVELDPLVTTIVGDNDRGKSSLVRAIRWLCLNRPQGHGFLRRGAKYVKVSLEADSHTIIRKKGKSNTYTLDDKVFSAVAASVPDQIKSLLNLDEVNFQRQHESAFWFFKTPGQVSKELNSIINLGEIDNTLAVVASNTRRCTQELESCEENLKEAQRRLDSLAWVEEADTLLTQAEEAYQASQETRSGLLRIRSLSEDRGVAALNRVRLSEAILEARKAYDTAVQVIEGKEWLDRINKSIKDREKACQSLSRIEEDLVEVERALSLVKSCPLCGKLR